MLARRPYHDRWALVTGASAGIGAAYARALAIRGANVVLVARRRDRLEALAKEIARAGVETVIIIADLSRQEAPDKIRAALAERDITIDILINNAGFGLTGHYTDRSWDEQRNFIELMVTSYAHLAHLVLPGMKQKGWGRMVNVSSVAGLLPPSAGHTLYGAAKAFLISFTQSLAAETAGQNINCSVLCPGFTYTEFHDVNGTRDRLENAMPKFMMLRPENIVADSLKALENRKTVCVPGFQYKAIVAFSRLLPIGLVEDMSQRQSRRYREP